MLQTEAALTYDAVYAFAHGMNDLSRATAAQLRPSNVSCGDGLSWAEGTSLFNLISMVDYYGLTGRLETKAFGSSLSDFAYRFVRTACIIKPHGNIRFNEGNRTSLKLDLLKLRQDRLVKVGEWTSQRRLNILNHGAFHDFGSTNITLRVTTIESVPFMMPKKQKAVVGAAGPGEGSSASGGLGAGAHREGSAAGAGSSTSSAAGSSPGSHGHYGAYHHQPHGGNSTGNIYEDYEGYIMDLLKILAEQLDFHYDLYLVPDNKFGVMNTSTQEWNGMVREIIEKVSTTRIYNKTSDR
ncbi:glutamate receptor [Tropilaelaps mercedesae]|uniref:Glutamate receptor n=1 Tax=Tropilaelaps mercedesae TaxID=418985 RepID=A0A1V9XZ58_9ACAR|nr:glutamate receptor [Tropilaelaps mercedesae]